MPPLTDVVHVPAPGDRLVHGHVGRGGRGGRVGPRAPVPPAHGVVGEEGVVGLEVLGLYHEGVPPADPLVPPGLVHTVQSVSVEAVRVGRDDQVHQLLVVGDSNISTKVWFIVRCILSLVHLVPWSQGL